MMERKHTVVYFLTAIALVAFGIILFMIPSGSILYADDGEGVFIYETIKTPLIAYAACLLGFLAIITVLQEIIEASLWFSAGTLIVVACLIGYWFGINTLIGVVASLVFGGWFLVAGIRSLIASWYDYEPWLNIVAAICRGTACAALFSYIPVWLQIPASYPSKWDLFTFSQIMADPNTANVCLIAGALSIAAAIGMAVEAILWIKTLDE